MGMTVLLVYGDGDFGAMDFDKSFDANDVYKEMLAEGVTEKDLTYDDGHGEEELHVSIHEFGEVDPQFVSFMYDNFINYDDTKAKDYYEVSAS